MAVQGARSIASGLALAATLAAGFRRTVSGAELFKRLPRCRSSTSSLLGLDKGAEWAPSTYNRPMEDAACPSQAFRCDTICDTTRAPSHLCQHGAPLIVVAQALGHSDTRMAEKHYAHLAPSYVTDTIRRLAPDI